ncbi:putative methyltransferase-domain-containing protein [Cyathus striatus]|nr:putative methyltransferase-domain-containing protein [Cyathus striatus]
MLPLTDHATWPVSLRGPVRLPPSADLVSNADDDVFILYTHLQAGSAKGRGLGYIDNTKDTLEISIELKASHYKDEDDCNEKRKDTKSVKARAKEKGKDQRNGENKKVEHSPEASLLATVSPKGKGKENTQQLTEQRKTKKGKATKELENGKRTEYPPEAEPTTHAKAGFAPISPPSPYRCLTGKEKRKARRSKDKEPASFAPVLEDLTIDLRLAQDSTALRSRDGDTGSVVWRASLDFANLILEQIRFRPTEGLFDFEQLKSAHVLELGSGTGLLPLLLSPHVQTYTSTDLPELLRLQEKTLALNPPRPVNLVLSALDWSDLASDYLTPAQRRRIFKPANPLDLILLVDCIYNPALLPALIATVEHLATPRQTAVLVVCELRASDVVRKFLESWLERPGWSIWRMEDGAGMGIQYGVWLGWRTV